jgi:hypothetical protein
MDTAIYGIGLVLIFLRPVLGIFLRKAKLRRVSIGVAVRLQIVVKLTSK